MCRSCSLDVYTICNKALSDEMKLNSKKIQYFVVLLCIFFTTRIYPQIAGEAVQFTTGSYFTVTLPPDSLEHCTIELCVNPTQNLDSIFLFYFGDPDTAGFGLYAS